jgi:hypothetical protein
MKKYLLGLAAFVFFGISVIGYIPVKSGIVYAAKPKGAKCADLGSGQVACPGTCVLPWQTGKNTKGCPTLQGFKSGKCYLFDGTNPQPKNAIVIRKGKRKYNTGYVAKPCNSNIFKNGSCPIDTYTKKCAKFYYAHRQCGDGKHNECDLVKKYIQPLINTLAALVGVVVTIAIIAGGIEVSASEGDPQRAAKGKNRIRNGLIALLAFFLLYAFLQYIVPGGIFHGHG